MHINEMIGAIIVLCGSVFLALGGLGLVRMPDVYNRMQAGTKATTLGNILTFVGLGIYKPEWLPKLLLIAFFVLLTNPLSSHALARAAHFRRRSLSEKTVHDAYAADGVVTAETSRNEEESEG